MVALARDDLQADKPVDPARNHFFQEIHVKPPPLPEPTVRLDRGAQRL